MAAMRSVPRHARQCRRLVPRLGAKDWAGLAALVPERATPLSASVASARLVNRDTRFRQHHDDEDISVVHLLIAAASISSGTAANTNAAFVAAQSAAHPILAWLRDSPIGAFVRGSTWAFPALQSLHFVGMSLLIGIVGAIDLRILGVARAVPLAPLHRFLPLAFIGFGINLVTGFCFFCHDPWVYAFNTSFRLKMLLILLAGLNALWFRLGVFLDLERWGPGLNTSPLAKIISAISLLIWIAVITAGRYIAFT
jgi:hypothetical protein